MINKNIKFYNNGNYFVAINLENGTKVRQTYAENATEWVVNQPESIDICISKQCKNGCSFCYLNCQPEGKHADLLGLKFIETLHPYTELALNINSEIPPTLIEFLKKCNELRLIPNITLHQKTFEARHDFIKELHEKKLIYGVGISLENPTDAFFSLVEKLKNVIIHTIAGILTISQMKGMEDKDVKILILGYKKIGKGKEFYSQEIEKNINSLSNYLSIIWKENKFNLISFDNLALEQLEIKKLLTDKEYKSFYMGNEGQFTMYIDAVDSKFAISSLEETQFDMTNDINTMWNKIKEVSNV